MVRFRPSRWDCRGSLPAPGRWGAAAVGVWLSGAIAAACLGADTRTNFLIVLCDDLGYGDLRCYGNRELYTPHLDNFAESGLRLTSCYSAHPNCSPSRTGLLTGRTPTRVGIHNWIPMLSPMHVPTSEVTVATLLRDHGYDTALAGKMASQRSL